VNRPARSDLRARLPQLTLRDERRLRRRLDKLRDGDERTLSTLAAAVAEAAERVERRRTTVPAVAYPQALPISARTEDIAAAIRDHQVVIVAGETGSGKTTQLPKICLEMGRGVRGVIGHTQPRRLAARTVAERIAEELGTDLGDVVGYEIRFTRRAGDDTLVKLMTDGILLASIQSDPLLLAYDTLIIDEAHERSLNIDFLIGYVARLLPRRPDLKVIITSATIDPQRFSHHFSDAPIIEVSGRTYPVEVRYRPLDAQWDGDDEDDLPDVGNGERDQTQGILDAVDELCAEGPGDILVFLSGEREIRDTADALAERDLRDTEILPLYARLATAQQRRVFQPHAGRRIVLATNVAETSLTVPGIHYVIDPGYARMSRYSARLKVQRLPIERISQASADQRKGRCGRIADGVCIRLYDEDDFVARPRFTEPEILRTNLASVLLQMASLGLGDVADFPFLDPPDARQVRDGMQLLHELGAIDPSEAERPRRRGRRRGRRSAGQASLTPVGRTLARLPIDPRLGRMIIEADRNGCLHEVLVIGAALSIPDPRQRPTDAQQAADALHARFADEESDFITWLNLWNHLREQRDERSSNQFRKMCRAEYLHYLRVREWQDLYGQLRRVAADLGMRRTDTPTEPASVHQSVLAGLLSHVGVRDGERHEYLGARGARFGIQPGSVLFKQSPRWVMAAELVETSRLWGRTVARIKPEWAERLGGHLVTRTYSEPHWEARRGGVVAYEKVSLYGIPLVTSRKVDYGAIDPEVSRDLFLRHALVEGDWRTHHAFWQRNQLRLADVETLEDKIRRRDVLVDDETVFAFYDERVGAEVVSTRHFDTWWKRTSRQQPDLLDLPWDLLLGAAGPGAVANGAELYEAAVSRFPDHWVAGDVTLKLSYRFEPGTATDGVLVHVPLEVLNRLRPEGFDWQVPGLRRELVIELLRTLPKDVRRRLVPIPDTADAVLARLTPFDGSLLHALERDLQANLGVTLPREAWQPERLPDHLRMTFQVEDAAGSIVAEDTDLTALQQRLATRVQASLTLASGIERRGAVTWEFGTLPQTFTQQRDGHAVKGFPALVDEGDSVAVRVLGSAAEQRNAMWAGTRRLLLLNAGSPVAQVHRRLDNATKLALAGNPHGSVSALLDDAVTCALDVLLIRNGGPVWDGDAFAALLRAVRGDLVDTLMGILADVAPILVAAADVDARLSAIDAPDLQPAVADLRTQLRGLVHPGFVTAKSARRLPDVARYVHSMQRRLDTLARDPARDRRRMERVAEVQQAYLRAFQQLPPSRRGEPEVRQIPWMIEELRVSEFAQALGTAYRISPERVLRAIDDIGA